MSTGSPNGVGSQPAIPGDWFALVCDYALDDLVAAGLDPDSVDILCGDGLTPAEK